MRVFAVLFSCLGFVAACRTSEPAQSPVDASILSAEQGGVSAALSSCGRDGAAPQCGANQICVQSAHGKEPGRCYEDSEQAHRPKDASLLNNLKTAAVPPSKTSQSKQKKTDVPALKITADVMTGSNACGAKGVKASLIEVVRKVGDENVHHIWPVAAKSASGAARICTREFKPVFLPATLTIKLAHKSDRVVVHGIQDAGRFTAKLVAGDTCINPECSQPPPGCFQHQPSIALLDERGCSVIKCGITECEKVITACPSGERFVPIGRDPVTGCMRDPVCVGSSTCPMHQLPPPGWCKGRIVSRGTDTRGCSLGAACVTEATACPQFSQHAPGWCSDGEIVGGFVNEDGCDMPPKCIRPGDCK